MQSPLKQHLAHAIRCHEAGNLTEAEGLYREILRQEPEHPDALYFLGVLAHQAGRPEAALDLLARVGTHNKRNAFYHMTLGNIYRSLGRLDEAARALREALRIKPDFAEAHSNLGIVLQLGAHLSEAYEAYQRALRLRPESVADRINAGNILQEWGRLDEAAQFYQGALNLAPNSVEASNNLGNVLLAQGQYDQARECFARALSLDPALAEAYYNMGNALKEQGEWDAAIDCYHQALAVRPDYAEVYNNLGNVLRGLGRDDEAVKAYIQARNLKPGFAEAWINLGSTLLEIGKLEAAIDTFLHALGLKHREAEIANSLGRAYQKLGQAAEAEQWLLRALAGKPDYADAFNNLGLVLLDSGKPIDGLAAFRKALAINPKLVAAHSNYLLALNYPSGFDSAFVFAEHQQFAAAHAEPLAAQMPAHANSREPGRKLRIAYVSPDFRRHSVAFFFEPILAAHNRETYEVYCYAHVDIEDEVTTQLRSLADNWRNIKGLNDEKAAALIRLDEIDILVDLAGHTGGNRLPVFAFKPAPVQVTYLGYPNTTGLPVMDYRVTDAIADPPGMTDRFYAEQLVRLPKGFLCYQPPATRLDIGPGPALSKGFVTFGCFNNFSKVNPDVVEWWAKILSGLPGSKLLLKSRVLADEATRVRLLARFGEQGIKPDRIELVPHVVSDMEHLELYNRIDVALDTFPYNGTTTTFEALWMGVPVVTLAGNVHAARVGASILSNVGLPELIAETPADYVAKAVSLAKDVGRRELLRREIRERLKISPLMDATAFTHSLELAYRDMWLKWCTSQHEPQIVWFIRLSCGSWQPDID